MSDEKELKLPDVPEDITEEFTIKPIEGLKLSPDYQEFPPFVPGYPDKRYSPPSRAEMLPSREEIALELLPEIINAHMTLFNKVAAILMVELAFTMADEIIKRREEDE